MFIAALFIVAKKRKQSKCLLIDKQMNKNPYHEMLFCHRMVVLIYAAIQLNLENILTRRSSSQKITCYYLHAIPRTGKSIDTK